MFAFIATKFVVEMANPFPHIIFPNSCAKIYTKSHKIKTPLFQISISSNLLPQTLLQ